MRDITLSCYLKSRDLVEALRARRQLSVGKLDVPRELADPLLSMEDMSREERATDVRSPSSVKPLRFRGALSGVRGDQRN